MKEHERGKVFADVTLASDDGITIALPLFWENQKINFAMRFSGYACSHWGTGKENF